MAARGSDLARKLLISWRRAGGHVHVCRIVCCVVSFALCHCACSVRQATLYLVWAGSGRKQSQESGKKMLAQGSEGMDVEDKQTAAALQTLCNQTNVKTHLAPALDFDKNDEAGAGCVVLDMVHVTAPVTQVQREDDSRRGRSCWRPGHFLSRCRPPLRIRSPRWRR